MIEVVAALIWDGPRFLICRRPANKARGLMWEFVGGKVEPGETGAQALARECREELDIDVVVGHVVADVTHAYPDLTVHLTLYNAVIAAGAPRLLEHSELRWVTIEEAGTYALCPADAQMLRRLRELHGQWLREEAVAHIHGWDFSHIRGRYAEEDDLPWDYRRVVAEYLSPDHRLLDIDTGGGEFLLSLKHPPENTAATEGYPPNAALCRQVLGPLGVDFREGTAEKLPFADGSFDVILNRHGSWLPGELRRALKPGGLFITQQVGAENDRELVELLLPGAKLPYPEQYLEIARGKLAAAGFEILRAEEAFRPIFFYDVGALVWFARIIEWEFPGFSVESCLPRLFAAQRMLEENGCIEGSIHRFLLVARKL